MTTIDDSEMLYSFMEHIKNGNFNSCICSYVSMITLVKYLINTIGGQVTFNAEDACLFEDIPVQSNIVGSIIQMNLLKH